MNNSTKKSSFYPLFLLILCIVIWFIASINASDKTLFELETILAVMIALFFIISYKNFRFSNLSYTLIFIYLALESVGAHYSFNIPTSSIFYFSFIKYDKIVHLAFGLLIYYPIKELFLRKINIKDTIWGYLIPLFFIMFLGSLYELWEWTFTLVSPTLGFQYSAFGSDFFDTQKDLAASFIGATIAILLDFTSKRFNTIRIKYS